MTERRRAVLWLAFAGLCLAAGMLFYGAYIMSLIFSE